MAYLMGDAGPSQGSSCRPQLRSFIHLSTTISKPANHKSERMLQSHKKFKKDYSRTEICGLLLKWYI